MVTTITSQTMGDCNLPCKNKLRILSGRPISIIIVKPPIIIAATAIISDILVKGVAQVTPDNLNTAVTNEPTKLMATKNTKLDM